MLINTRLSPVRSDRTPRAVLAGGVRSMQSRPGCRVIVPDPVSQGARLPDDTFPKAWAHGLFSDKIHGATQQIL